MQKQNDALAQFTAARSALLSEREAIQQKLQHIDAALNGSGQAPRPAQRKKRGRPPGKSNRVGNKMGVREAIAKATAGKPLTIREIVEAVQKLGYKFASKNPQNSVGAFLYSATGKKHFKRANGKFLGK